MADIDRYKNNPMALQAWQEGYEEGLDQCDMSLNSIKIVIVVAVCIFGVLAASGCSDQYRYPCQDPANQANTECTPPECEADGTCTGYLVETHK